MFVIGIVLTLISAAGCGASILGYFIDFPNIQTIAVAVGFAALCALSAFITLTDYRIYLENKKVEKNV